MKRIRRYLLYSFILLCTLPLLTGLMYGVGMSLEVIGVLGKGFTSEHWFSAVQESSLWYNIGYSVLLSSVIILLCIVLASVFSFQSLYRGRASIPLWLFLIPLAFPPVVSALAWKLLLRPKGWLYGIFGEYGADHISGIGIVLSSLYLYLPLFCLLFIYQNQRANMKGFLQASTQLGAGKWDAFWKVYLPLLIDKTKGFIVLYSCIVFGMYEIPDILGVSHPRWMSQQIYDTLFRFDLYSIPKGYAYSLIYSVVVLVWIVVRQRKSQNHA